MDLIDRDALLASGKMYSLYEIGVVKAVPTIDAVPVVHGAWIGSYDGYADGFPVYDMWECSNCGFDADGADEKPDWNFCPNCGARMKGNIND